MRRWLLLLALLLALPAGAATLLGEWRLEEDAWTGAAGEVRDSSGNSRHGTAIGVPLPGLDATTPARGGSPGTCDYGVFGGNPSGGPALTLPGLPVSTSAGAQTSVAFWMYWDGSNNVMPVGWNVHDLWLVNGHFGFNTGNSDIFGIASAGLANGWRHVVAVFTNGAVGSNELYIDGVKQTLTQRLSSPNNANAYVRSTLQVSGWGANTSYRFSGRIDEVRVYSGAVSQAEVNAVYAATHVCPTHPPPPPATLAAEYRFDQPWSASVPLLDSSGNGIDAVLLGGTVDQDNAPASGLKPDTCKAGDFTRSGYFSANGLSLDTRVGAKATVAFWMYWDGRYPSDSWAMPFRWAGQYYDLGFKSNGRFGFNTGQGDVYGISSAGLANGWHHVVAVFTSGGVGSNKIYLDGQLRALQSDGTHASRLISTGAYIGAGGNWSSGYKFGGSLDSLNIYNGELTQAEVDTLYRQARPCGGACGPVPASYPLYAAEKLEIGNNGRVNGHAIASTSGGTYDAVNAANGALVTTSLFLPALDPATFPTLPGGADISGTNIPAGAYDEVKPANNATFSGGTYYIDKLKIENNRRVSFAAGSYFIDEADIGNNVTLVFTGAARFYIRDKFDGGSNLEVNVGGTPSLAQFFLYGNAEWEASSNADLAVLLYSTHADSKIDIGSNLTLHGAFVSAGKVDIGNNATLVYGGAEQSAIGGVSSCAAVTPPPSSPAALNAVDVGAHPVAGKITTKSSGAAFNLDLHALNAARTGTDTAINGDILVDLLVNTQPGVALDANNCPANATVLAVGTVTLASGKATASMGAIADAWRDARVRMRYPASGAASLTACSTDNFAIKPATLSAIASHADWQTAGVTTTLANSGASGGAIHKAGKPFTLRVTGYNANNVVTGNYSGSPTAVATCVLPASGCFAGALDVGAYSTNAGTAVSHTASYSEVGAISAVFTDSAWASVDAGDTAASCAGHHVCSGAIQIGRFVPDHFDIATNTAAFAPACGSFTYLGQPFGFDTGSAAAPLWTVSARNAGGTLTRNYSGNLFKISAASVTGQAWGAASGTVAAVGTLPAVSVTDLGGGLGSLLFSVGAPAGGGGLAFSRATPLAPFDASLTLAASVADSEGVTHAANPYQHGGIGFDDGNAATTSDAQMRFGRLRLTNAVGSELLPLPLPLIAQHWDGQGYASNSLDYCTSISSPTLTFFSQSADNQLASGETVASFNATLVAGNGNLRFTAPGAGNFGFMDVSVAAPAWLRFNWDGVDQGGDGNLLDDAPRARASFGKRRGSDKVIIRREMY